MSNIITRIVVKGIFDLLQQWWVWVGIAVIVGFVTGTLTQQGIVTILNKLMAIVK